VENISSVLRFFNEDTKVVTERLLALATSSSCDAQALTELICSELDAAGLATSSILSQVYDGAAVMSNKHGEVQRLLQEREGREIPYVHYLNHQLHLVVVHALSEEQAVQDFFEVCNGLYNFFRKPTIASQYNGEKLKRLLDQR